MRNKPKTPMYYPKTNAPASVLNASTALQGVYSALYSQDQTVEPSLNQ